MKKILLFLLLNIYSISLFSQVDTFIQITGEGNIYTNGAIQLESGDYVFISNKSSNNYSQTTLHKYDYYGSFKQNKIIELNNVYFEFIQLLENGNFICKINEINDTVIKSGFVELNSNLEIEKEYGFVELPTGITGYFRKGFRVKDNVKICFYVCHTPFIDIYYGDKYYRKFLDSWIYDIQILDDEYFYIYKSVEHSDKAIVQKVKIDGYQIVKTFNIEKESGLSFDYTLGKYLQINNDKLYFYNNNANYNYKGSLDFDNDYIVMDTGLNEILKLHVEETPEDERNSNYDDYMIRAIDGTFFTINYLMTGGIRLTKLDPNFDIIFSKVYNITCLMVTAIVPTIDGGCLVLIDGNKVNSSSNIYKFDKDGNIETKQTVQDKTNFVVYPNPATDFLNIQNTYLLQNSQLFIFNTSGQKIMIKNLNDYLNTVDVSNFKTGMYFYQLVKLNKVEQSGKFVVRR